MAVIPIVIWAIAMAATLDVSVTAAVAIVVTAFVIGSAITYGQYVAFQAILSIGAQPQADLINSLAHQSTAQLSTSQPLTLPSRQLPDRSMPVNQLPTRQLPDRTDPRAWQPPTVITQPQPQCPPGYSWNPQTEQCEPDVTIPIPPPNPNPQQTDFGTALQTFCQNCLEPEIAAPLAQLAQTLADAIGAGSPLIAMATALVNLANQLGPELAPLGTILPNLIGALTNLDLAALVNATDSIRTQIETCCNELQTILKQSELPAAKYAEIYQKMAADGVIDPANEQLFSDPVRLRIDPARIHPEVRKALKYFGAVTPGEANRAWAWIEATLTSWIAYLKPYARTLLDGLSPQLYDIVTSIGSNAGNIISLFSKLETTLPKDAFDAVIKIADLGESTTPDQIEEAAFKLFGAAFLAGQALHLLAGLASFVGYPMSSVWANNASLLVDLLAFDEIRSALHGAFFKAAIEAKASQKYLSVHRPYPLSLGEASMAFGRREISEADFDSLAALAGKQAASLPSMKKLAYHPIPPFILGSAFVDQPIPHAALTGALQRGQIDPSDFGMLATALENRSVQTLRNAVITEATTAAKAGFMSLTDLDDQVNAAFATLDVNSLLHISAIIGQLSTVATTTLRAALAELRTGTLSAQAASALMTAAGIQDWRINLEITLGAAQAAAAAARKAEAQELTFARKSFTQTLTTIGLNFLSGQINAVAFTAEAEAGLITFIAVAREIGEPDGGLATESAQGQAMIASRLALLEAQMAGRAIMVYGLMLDRKQAFVLRARVSALEEATIRTDITAAQAHQSLLDLGIGPLEATALVDRWKLQDYPKGTAPLGAGKPHY